MQTERQPAPQKENVFTRFIAWRKKRRAIAKEKEKNMTLKQKILSWLVLPLYALLIAAVVHLFIGELVRVDGTSMTNTLQNGEVVWCSKLSYLVGQPQRNDIVICHYPGRVNERGSSPIHISGGLTINTYTIFIKPILKRWAACPGTTPSGRWARTSISWWATTASPPMTAGPTMWAPSPAAKSWER